MMRLASRLLRAGGVGGWAARRGHRVRGLLDVARFPADGTNRTALLSAQGLPGGMVVGFPWSGGIGGATASASPLRDCDIHLLEGGRRVDPGIRPTMDEVNARTTTGPWKSAAYAIGIPRSAWNE
jgi:hypothetical protein